MEFSIKRLLMIYSIEFIKSSLLSNLQEKLIVRLQIMLEKVG